MLTAINPEFMVPSPLLGQGPQRVVVVSTAAFHARVRGSFPGLGGLKETKMSPRGSVFSLKPSGFEFRTLCLEGSVISLISPSSGGPRGPVYPICAQMWPKARFISFYFPAFGFQFKRNKKNVFPVLGTSVTESYMRARYVLITDLGINSQVGN